MKSSQRESSAVSVWSSIRTAHDVHLLRCVYRQFQELCRYTYLLKGEFSLKFASSRSSMVVSALWTFSLTPTSNFLVDLLMNVLSWIMISSESPILVLRMEHSAMAIRSLATMYVGDLLLLLCSESNKSQGGFAISNASIKAFTF